MIMKPYLNKKALIAATCLSTCITANADQAVLIGGGYDLRSSQVQIESNTQWARDSLDSLGVSSIVYFTDGDDDHSDVNYLAPDEEYSSPFEALSRVYGYHVADRLRYRSHTLADVKHSASADAVTQNLSQHLSETQQDTFLVFNGHGSASPHAPHQVGMKLWNNSSIQADELHKVLSIAKKPVRFTSESAYQLSEGCSASVDTSEYRDYTTYFFAALSGYDRYGEILPVETDMDKDGAVSLREAHLYSIENAVSTDIAHSSSEHYLERWEPWYLKWLPARRALPNNEYAKLFRKLASKHNMPLEGNAAKTIREAMDAAEENKDELRKTLTDTADKKYDVQAEIQLTAELNWPTLSQPYTAAFKELMAGDAVPEISKWVSEHENYPALVALQDEETVIRKKVLEAERKVTQLQKMLRMRKLAQLKQELYQYGTAGEKSAYERILVCEKAPLTAAQ